MFTRRSRDPSPCVCACVCVWPNARARWCVSQISRCARPDFIVWWVCVCKCLVPTNMHASWKKKTKTLGESRFCPAASLVYSLVELNAFDLFMRDRYFMVLGAQFYGTARARASSPQTLCVPHAYEWRNVDDVGGGRQHNIKARDVRSWPRQRVVAAPLRARIYI